MSSESFEVRKHIEYFAELYCSELHNKKRDVKELDLYSNKTLQLISKLQDKYGEFSNINVNNIRRKYGYGLDDNRNAKMNNFLNIIQKDNKILSNYQGGSAYNFADNLDEEMEYLIKMITTTDYYLSDKKLDKLKSLHSNTGDSISEYLQIRNHNEYTLMEMIETTGVFISKGSNNNINKSKNRLKKLYGNRLIKEVNIIEKSSSILYKLKIVNDLQLARLLSKYKLFKTNTNKDKLKLIKKAKGNKKESVIKELKLIEKSMENITSILKEVLYVNNKSRLENKRLSASPSQQNTKLVSSILTKNEKIKIMDHMSNNKNDSSKFNKSIEKANITMRKLIDEAKESYILNMKKKFKTLKSDDSVLLDILISMGKTSADAPSVLLELESKSNDVLNAISNNKQYLFIEYTYPLLTEILIDDIKKDSIYMKVNDDYYIKQFANELKYILIGLDNLSTDVRFQRLQQETLKYKRELDDTNNQLSAIKLFLVGKGLYNVPGIPNSIPPPLSRDNNNECEKRVRNLQEELNIMTAKFNSMKDKCDNKTNMSEGKLKDLEDEIRNLKEKLDSIQHEKRSLERKVIDLNLEIGDLNEIIQQNNKQPLQRNIPHPDHPPPPLNPPEFVPPPPIGSLPPPPPQN